ncbi:hypothetical protein [Streptomyces sp. Y1]|uniref:APC family permease n=1 Tax=Streptomyces sp. Y1 TaxID=3238634 RepID=A0AB39TGD2_9ACTN
MAVRGVDAVGGSGAVGGARGIDRLKADSVGLPGVVFMAVATAAPITAMTGNLPIVVGQGNGVGAPAAYVVATAVLTVFSVGYVAMARHITAAGAFYGYVSHGLGRVVGMASGLLAVLAYIVFEASVLGFFAYALRGLVRAQLGVELGWGWYALFGLAAIGVTAWFDLHLTAKVLGVALVLLVLNRGAAAGVAAGTLLFRLIPYLVVGVFLGGIGLALAVRWRRPELYARLGRIVLEDAVER